MADVDLLPCGVEHELRADAAIIRSWIDVANGPINREALADRLDRYANAAAAQSAEVEALRAEVERLKSENARIREALQAIVDEVSDGLVPYSSDSYLPAHLVEQACAVLSKENSND